MIGVSRNSEGKLNALHAYQQTYQQFIGGKLFIPVLFLVLYGNLMDLLSLVARNSIKVDKLVKYFEKNSEKRSQLHCKFLY